VKLTEAASGGILILDIETSPTLTYTFGMRPKWISPEKIVEPSRMLCFAAKWYARPRIHYASEYHHSHEAMVEKAWTLLDQAAIVVTFNGIGFDLRHLRREFHLAQMPPPRPWKDVDLYREAKRSFDYESHSLNHLAQRLGVGEKSQTGGFDLWRGCLARERAAWATMKAYNIADVELTERLYDRMRGWLPSHPHHGTGDEARCNQCGSSDLERVGTTLAQVITYVLYRCRACGANVRGGFHSRQATTRGVR